MIEHSRYQIFSLDNNLLCDDNIVDVKSRLLIPSPSEGILITFDKKYYFNLASKNLIFKEIKDNAKKYNKVEFDKNKFDKYKKELWHKVCFDGNPVDDSIDIYIENNMDELDPEVKDLVYVINKLPCVKTISSCSGHGNKPLSISMVVYSICILEIINNIIFKFFKNKFILETTPLNYQKEIGGGFSFQLKSKKMGEKAYFAAKELTEKLEDYVKNDLDKDYGTIIKFSDYSVDKMKNINVQKDKMNNERYQIYDLNNKLLVDDIVDSYKSRALMNPLNGEGVLISFDSKHYFNMACNELKFIKMDVNKNFAKVEFDINNFSKYKIDLWHKICFDKELIDNSVVIYREYDINELDPEVKNLVNILNKLPCVHTIASCSGHNERFLTIAFRVSSIGILEIISKIIFENFDNDFELKIRSGYGKIDLGEGINVELSSKEIGTKAYEKVDELKEKINDYIVNNLDDDFEQIILHSSDKINKFNIDENKVDIENEVFILKNTLNKMKYVYVDLEKKDFENYKPIIELKFYDIKTLYLFLEILWNDFRNDFILRTDDRICYISEKSEKNIGFCFVLEFVMPTKELIFKTKALNQALLKKNILWKE